MTNELTKVVFSTLKEYVSFEVVQEVMVIITLLINHTFLNNGKLSPQIWSIYGHMCNCLINWNSTEEDPNTFVLD
jgi:hypothetical protein